MVRIIALADQRQMIDYPSPPHVLTDDTVRPGPDKAVVVRTAEGGRVVPAQREGNAGVEPSYLRAAEVADLLHVSPKTVARWAKEGKLPFMKTLGGHRRYPEAEIRELVDVLRQEPTA